MTSELTICDIKPITEKQNQILLDGFDKMRSLNCQNNVDNDNILNTNHFLHAGCYVRTCLIKQGGMIGSALIKVPTVVIISGCIVASNGEDRTVYSGYKILKGSAFRRAVWCALKDTYITMFFATNAKNVTDATKEFTDEWESLLQAEE